MASENAYAARVQNGIVRQVIAIPYCNDDDAEITAYCNALGLDGEWLDTAFTGSRRGKFAAVGDVYDATLDKFVTFEQEHAPPVPSE